MIKKSAYRPVGFRVPQNYVDKIEPKGVDFSSPQMEANKDRGVYSINYRYNGKKGEKRWGYQKVGYAPEANSEHSIVRGIWSFVGEYTKTKRTIAYIYNNGYCELYEMVYSDERWSFTKITGNQIDTYLGKFQGTGEFLAPESATVVGNQMYLLNGSEMVRVYEKNNNAHTIGVEGVQNANYSYIPTTMILIAPKNAKSIPSEGNAFYESPNLITGYRKNNFLCGIELASGETCPTYELDGKADVSVACKIQIEASGIYPNNGWPSTNGSGIVWSIPSYRKFQGEGVEFPSDYSKYVANPFGYAEEVDYESLVTGGTNRRFLIDSEDSTDGYSWVDQHYISSSIEPQSGKTVAIQHYGVWFYIGEIASSGNTKLRRILGYVDTLEDGTATLTLLDNYSISGREGNVTFQYYAKGFDSSVSDQINKSRYFARFGHNNKLNTAWVYGNPDKPNYMWNCGYAEQQYEIDNEVHNADEDFTYWPTDAYRKLGEPNSKIVGAEVVSESKMMVLKTKGGNSPTMYFISPVVVTKDMDGDNTTTDDTYTYAEYSTFQSNTSTAGIVPTPKGICNLNGDILFYSNERQLAGLDIEGITGDSRRAANTRSAYIDRELAKLNPASVKLFAFGNYLILDSDTKTFCAHTSQYNSETRQYEWWEIDNINATFFYEDDDGNAFYTDDKGGIYLLANSTIDETGRSKKVDIDRYFINSETGDLGLYSRECFETSSAIRDRVCGEEGWKFKFDEENMAYAILFNDANLNKTSNDEFGAVYSLKDGYHHLDQYITEGSELVIEQMKLLPPSLLRGKVRVHIYDEDSTLGKEFYFELVEGDEGFEKDGKSGWVSNYYAPLTGEYPVEAVDGVAGGFRILVFDELRDYYYIPSGNAISGEFSKETPIQSMWISRPVPLAKFSYDKTIKQVDVYNDTQEPAELYIGCITNKQLHTYQYARIEAFDLGNIDFENTTFDQNRVPVIYHMRRFPRKHQYFSLVQMSTGTDNSLLSDMDITYTLQGVARNKK